MISLTLIVVVFLSSAQCMYVRNTTSEPPVTTSEPPVTTRETPAIYRTTCEFVKHYGYPCESHEVKTEDDYLLTMHRIPHGVDNGNRTSEDPRPVVFLQHGIMDSSAGWVLNEPNKSLAFLLADRGYDVWMGNNRGNTYSEKHVFLSPSEEKFWDYSFHEMGEYDLPASIGFVLERTGVDDLSYIGHSQGTTQAFSGFSRNKVLASKINMFIALAPVAYLNYASGLLRLLSNQNLIVQFVMKLLGTKQFLPSSWIMKFFASQVCGKLVRQEICEDALFLIVGSNTGNMDMERFPIYITHTPAGTSMKCLWHYSQLIQGKDKFQMYDYGWNGNMEKYKQPVPPPYHIGEMRVPIALFTGDLDVLSTIPDVELHLRHNFPNLMYFHMEENWNHLDFMWARNAKELIYDKVFKLLAGEIPKQ